MTRRDEPGYYDLWSEKDVLIADRRRMEVFFAGLIVQKTYVGFSLMCVYADGDLRAAFGPELLATLQNKACFHIGRYGGTADLQPHPSAVRLAMARAHGATRKTDLFCRDCSCAWARRGLLFRRDSPPPR